MSSGKDFKDLELLPATPKVEPVSLVENSFPLDTSGASESANLPFSRSSQQDASFDLGVRLERKKNIQTWTAPDCCVTEVCEALADYSS